MTTEPPIDPKLYAEAISSKNLSIYDPIDIGDPDLWIPTPELEAILNENLRGYSLGNYPIKTRSKVAKIRVCEILGYAAPKSFKRTRPRFPGQNFDVYVQKANNFQPWNEEVSASRRYVLIRVYDGLITRVKVVTGALLGPLDTTGKLTRKYQARCTIGGETTELVTAQDTDLLLPLVTQNAELGQIATPILHPAFGELLEIKTIYEKLSKLVGQRFVDAGVDQERNRGAALHRLVCTALGYKSYQDDGQFPDVRHQLLEIKLQTSPTIDLGLVTPESVGLLDVPKIKDQQIRHCDVRYGIFYGTTSDGFVTLTHFILSTGEAFFSRFPQFQGKISNSKLQIPLPANFFET